ncbi:growth inhibitor PemK [Aphanothece hegewaldii CCALA 016]|uniref:mRNA interferase n=1 Tax=Aphanothece hegewaldii CCALA 016 TaxID=2107694 RepID=A0A2T1LX49_9CHRO|nr:type II toxin-antitoxin system PemK/MazF family toxin [Aphanothece hegewaldii]PSF36756.1 growth inhibitor PemK [Aphanothece hegewaldii CCALA 016]
MAHILREEVWLVDLNPARGREQAGTRPSLIISVDRFNQSAAALVICLPITSKDKKIPFHVSLAQPEGGLNVKSFIKCEDVRSLSSDRLIKCLGVVSAETMVQVEARLRILMGL